MSHPAAFPRLLLSTITGLVVTTLAAAPAQAQAFSYPSFQPPRVVSREFNFGVADAGSTTLIFQWREGMSQRSQFSLDLGFADPDGRNNDDFLLIGGQFAALLTEARPDLPLSFLLTAGINLAVSGSGNLLRIPIGVSLGHRFALDQGMSVTPYIHPRISFDNCSECGRDDESQSQVGIDFDLGVNFDVNRSLAFRLSALFGGSELLGNDDGFGLSLAWAPRALSRLR